MRSIEYYCGIHFDARSGQELTAVQWLTRKISASEMLVIELMEESWMYRDMNRVSRIIKAQADWKKQLNEIFGIQEEVE